MRSALLAAALVGVAAPAVGIFMVQRRLSLMGDGIAHVVLTGVAAGALIGTSPPIVAVVAAIIGAVTIEIMRERGKTSGDVALALIFYGGIAGGVLFASLANMSDAALFGYLFGSVLTVGPGELWVVGAMTLGVVGLTSLFRKELFSVCYDEEVARVSGLPVRVFNMLLAVIAAVTIAVSMRVVGVLLVSAMLVVPVAAAQQLTRSFRGTWLGGVIFGFAASVLGVIGAYYLDVRPAATIVLLAILMFAVTSSVAGLRRARA